MALLAQSARLRHAARYLWHGPPGLPRPLKLEWQLVPARWLAIFFVAPGLWLANFSADQLNTAYVIVGIGALFNLAVQTGLPRWPAVFASGFVTTVGDSLLSLAMVKLAGGFDSPLSYVFFVVTVSAAMRFSYGPSLAVALVFVTANATESLLAIQTVDSSVIFRSGFLCLTAVLTSYLHGQLRKAETELLEERLHQASELNNALAQQASHDSLTNLPNRILFRDRLQQIIAAGLRNGTPAALLLMDLDRFKDVNDTLGHHYGDRLLEQIGPRLQEFLRESDTVARLGGDEFALLLPGTDRHGATLVARKLRQAVEQRFSIQGHSVHVGASLGIALFPEHGDDSQTLLRHADVAMYVAKGAKSGYAVYEPEQDRRSTDRVMLVEELRNAIDTEQLTLCFQPKVSIPTGCAIGVEALVRWNHPRRGLIGPDEFIPQAEHAGLMKPLGKRVMQAALRQCWSWQQAGFDIPVAVNLSMPDLHDPELPDTISELLALNGLAATCLRVEITETSVMADAMRAMETLTSLCAMGVAISIDDFGTGYSSLAYLQQLPVDELKIDKSFVQKMAVNAGDTAIVRSTIGLGHDLGLSVVAEGVEDQATWDGLSRLGCDAIQGYYLCRPIPGLELVDWLRRSSQRDSACLPDDAAA